MTDAPGTDPASAAPLIFSPPKPWAEMTDEEIKEMSQSVWADIMAAKQGTPPTS